MTMVKVRILEPGPYRVITTSPGTTQTKVGTEMLSAGDEREYDLGYAQVLEDNDLIDILGVVTDPEPVENLDMGDNEEEVGDNVPDGIDASANAKKLAEEYGLDLTLVQGTGPEGKITIKDVNDYLKVEKALAEEAKLAEEE